MQWFQHLWFLELVYHLWSLMSVSVAAWGIRTDQHSGLFLSHAATHFLKLISHEVFYSKCLFSSYNTLIDDCSRFDHWESERSVPYSALRIGISLDLARCNQSRFTFVRERTYRGTLTTTGEACSRSPQLDLGLGSGVLNPCTCHVHAWL